MKRIFLILVSCVLCVGAAQATCSTSSAPTDTLCAGSSLSDYSTTPPGIYLHGTEGYNAYYGPAGWMALYNAGNTFVYKRWSSQAAGGQLKMQMDGNLVQYDSSQSALWSSGTSGSGNYARLLSSGDFGVFSSGGSLLWHTGTAGFSIGGSVTGSLVTLSLTLNGVKVETMDSAPGSFAFDVTAQPGESYEVTTSSGTVTNGSGTTPYFNVTNVVVNSP